VAHELVEDRPLRVEVEVEGARGDARLVGDLHDRRLVEAQLAEHALGGVEQPPSRVEPALRERTPVDIGDRRLAHVSAGTFSSDFWILPSEFRGSSSTAWNAFGTL